MDFECTYLLYSFCSKRYSFKIGLCCTDRIVFCDFKKKCLYIMSIYKYKIDTTFFGALFFCLLALLLLFGYAYSNVHLHPTQSRYVLTIMKTFFEDMTQKIIGLKT